MKKIKLVLLLLVAALTTQASGGADALREFSKRMAAMKGFSLHYEYMVQSSIGFEDRQSGSLMLSGSKYHIEMENTTIVYDGTARYTYLKKENEIVIETPNPLRDGIFADPSTIFSINYKDFNVKQTSDGGTTMTLELTPKQNGQPYEKISLALNKSDYYPAKIVYYGTDGRVVSFVVSGFKANIVPEDAALFFDIKRYPQAEVVDMR